jgi:adenylate kinase family enzyme
MALRVYILGASGAGVSTLGGALARALAVPAFDVDDYYWMPTDPPFRIKRPVEDRIRRLQTDLMLPSWVLSGSLDGWGDPVADLATHVVYVDTPAALRIARLRQREQARFGARIACGGDMHAHHKAFLDWAATYDTGDQPGLMSRAAAACSCSPARWPQAAGRSCPCGSGGGEGRAIGRLRSGQTAA